jgi:hypothetical protein
MAEFDNTNPLLIGVQGDEDQTIKNPDPEDVDGDGIPDAIDPVIEVLGETVEDEQTQISDDEAEELMKLHAEQEQDRLDQELEQRRIDEEKAHRERTMNMNLSYGVELDQRNESQIFLDDLEEQNFNMDLAFALAEREGLNVDDVASEMRRRNGVGRERYNYQFEENLAALKARKQEIVNERERMRRKTEGEYDIDYDLIDGSDTEFTDSYGRLTFLKEQLAKFEAGELSDGDIINFYQQLDEVYGLELGTEAIINEQVEDVIKKTGIQYLPDAPLTGAAGGAAMAAIIGQLGPQVGLPEEVITVPGGAMLGYILGSVRKGTEFIGDKTTRALLQMGVNPNINPLAGDSREDYLNYTGELMNWLVEEETGTLGELINDQNDINGKVKFRTDFTVDDADYIYGEIVDRDEDLKYFNDTYRHFSEEGLNIGEHVLGWAKPFTDIGEAAVVGVGQFLEHETGIDFVNEQRKQNREAYMSALELAHSEIDFGLEEENIQRTWFGTTGAMFNGDVSVGEWARKSGKFLHSLSGDMLTAYLAYGRAAKSSSRFVRKAVPNIYTGTMFFRGYKHFQDSLDRREDLTEDEKHLLSSIAGASEAFLAHTLRYAERGLAGNWKKPTKNVEDTIKRRAGETKKQFRARSLEEAKKLGRAAWRKAMWTEAFEEGAQSLIEQNLANVYDMALGKTPKKDFNVFEFMDSTFGGLIFGTAGGRGAYRQQIAHHTILQKKESIKKALEVLQGKIDRTPPGDLRDEYEREYLDFQDQLFELNSIGRGFYSRLDSEQTGKVRQINNRLIELQYLIADKNTSKEEREDLLKEFESLYKQKSEIESSVLTEEDMAEINKERPNSENIIDKLISRLTESQDVSDETSADHEGRTSRPAAEVQEEAETISQINKLLQQYKSSREKALQEKDPRKKRALQAAASRARTRARNLANQIGITGSDFVQVLDNAEQGEFITQPEVAPETTEAANRIKEIDAELAELEGDPTGVKNQAQLDRINELKAERKNLVEQSMVAPDAAPEAEGATEDDVDFTEDKTVYDLGGEGNTIEDADPRISRMIVNAVNRLNKAFKKVLKALNATIHIHNTENSFYGITESLKKKGRVDLLTRTQANQSITWGVMLTKPDGSIEIHLNPEARVEDVSEEFAHAVLLPILRRDSKARRALYNELLKMAGLREVTTKDETGKDVTMLQVIPGAEFNESARNLLMNRGAAYEGESQAMFEEEAIVGFLKEYAKPDGASKFETPDTRSKLRKFWDGIKGMFRGFTKRNKSEANIINYNDSLLDFARKFSKATKGVETDVQARPGAEQQAAPAAEEVAAESRGQRFSSTQQKIFNEMGEGVELFFTKVYETEGKDAITRVTGVQNQSVKVNDYYHFKNAYAKFTGNGQKPSLMKDMYYIDSNGDKQQVNPPRPKLDREGNIIQMPAPESVSYGERVIQQRVQEQSLIDEVKAQVRQIQDEVFNLLRNNDKNLNRHTQTWDFSPVKRDEFDIGIRRSLEDHMEELENLIITKANIQALIDSEITEQDLAALRGGDTYVSPSKHASIYNMSGMLKESQKREALELQEPDSPMITLSEGTDPDSMVEGEEEAFSQGYRSIAELESDSELDDAVFRNLKIFNVDLEDITILDLLAEGDAGLGVVSYDQLSKINKFNLKFVDGDFNINSGVGQIKESLDAGENLSLSHASSAERQKTLNRLKESWNRGDRLFHVFINNNGVKQSYKNAALFGPLVQNVIGAAKSNETTLTEKEVIDLFTKGLAAEAKNMGAHKKGNKTGYQFIEFSPQFRAMTDAEKAELGWDGNKLDIQTIEQLEKVMDIFTLVSSFPAREAFAKETKFLNEGFAKKHGLPTQADIKNNLIEQNYVGEKGANKPGVVSTVLTIDLNEIFDEAGNVRPEALVYKEGLPFGYQLLGAKDLRKLSKKRSTRVLFNVDAGAAANDLITDTTGGTRTIDMAKTEGELGQRDDREAGRSDVDRGNKRRDGITAVKRTPNKAEKANIKRQDALDKLQEARDKHSRGEVSDSYLEGFEQNTEATIKRYEATIEKEGGKVAETQPVKQADIKLTLNNTNQVESPTQEQLDLFDEVVQANSQGYRQINVPGDPATWNLNEQSTMERAMENFQKKFVDKYQAILNLQQQVEESKGGKIPEGQDFRMMETLLYGKAATDMEKLDNNTKALVDSMKENGVTEPELSEYLYALHAKERNAVILERTGEQNGSGMSDADADAILNKLSPEKKAQLEKSAAIVRDILKNTRDTYIALGLHTKEDVDAWENMFEHYIPLQGWAVDEDNEITSAYPTGGKSLSVTDSMVKRATGRKTAAANVVAQVIAQNAAAHIKGRTNEAVRALYNLIESNPNDKVWKILDWADRSDPHVVGVRVDGQQKWIYFNDVSHAETLRGMNMPSTSFLPKILKSATGWLRASFTTLNPEFVISNFSRDIQSAIFNAAAEAEIEGGQLNGEGVIQQMMKDIPKNLKALIRGAVGLEMSAEEAAWFQDFIEDGGRTGWAYAKDLNEIAQELSEAAGDKSRMQEILGKAKNFKKTVEGINDAFENAIRLSAYMAARKAGISRSKAAEFAKNITVNFNKHGEYGQALNAVYLFFNASIQGTARLGRSLIGSKPALPDGAKRNWFQRRTNAQKMAFGLGIFNAMLTMLNYALSDDDEDGVPYYDKIPDYVKERNLIIMNPAGGGVGKDYIKIPMPYGFNVFANFGSAAVEYANGGRELDSAGMFLFNSAVSSFSPISFGQSEDLFKYGAKAISPTVIKPWVEAAINETYFGTPVTAEQNPFATPKPNSSMSFRSPDAVKQFFSWMNEATGGTVHKGGIVDINPDKYWYIFQYYTGGVGQFITRTGETTAKIGQRLLSEGGEDIKINYNDIPMLRKMYGETSKYYDFNKYYENKETIKQLRREIQDPDIKFDPKRHNNVNALNNKLNSIEKQLKQLRKKLREAKDIDNYVDRTVRVQELQDKQRKLVMQFNEMYDKLRK